MLAPAKVNLSLHVGPKRADGYHDVFSLVAFASIGDELEIEPADKTDLIVKGPFADQLAGGDRTENIVWAAAARLLDLSQDATGSVKGLRMTLTKRLPVASGIGGGSADAAVALRLGSRCLGLSLGPEELGAIGLSLGADIPVCLFAAPGWMSGIGDVISPAPQFPEVHIVLVNPGKPVSTKAVFEKFDSQESGTGRLIPHAIPTQFADFAEFIGFIGKLRNDLERPAKQIRPEIEGVLQALRESRAALARMSGSGATCFGLFPTKSEAERCAQQMRLRHSGWWIDVGSLMRE